MITTELKHTPGIWVPVNLWDKYFITGPHEYNIDDEGRHSICELFGPDAAENQKIILAAPLLLSALIKAMEDHESLAEWFNAHKSNMRTEYPVPDWVNEAKAALAAAGVTFKPLQP